MIPFGPWHPDKAGINTPVCREAVNCLPGLAGYLPSRSLAATSAALSETPLGAATVIDSSGGVHNFAGTESKLNKLLSSGSWDDVSRTAGGPYAVAGGEKWAFATFGDIVIATAITDFAQKYTLNSSTDFSALGGSPPKARYVAVVRDFVVLGGILSTERRVQWSGINNAESWTPGTASSDYQDFPDGGPVRGILGGEVGYVFQQNKITRMVFSPGSPEIFQFDEVGAGRGLAAPASLVKLGRRAYYFANDGLFEFDCGNGVSTPLGIGKWAKWFLSDIKGGTESLIMAGLDPSRRLVLFAYVPSSAIDNSLTRVLAYDWSIEEAAIMSDGVPYSVIASWLTTGVTLDTMNGYGNMETLPFSLDSPYWRGGAPALAVFGADKKLSYFSGVPMAAQWVTADGAADGRQLITATRPQIDTTSTTVAVAMRERDGDAVSYDTAESLEDTGECPAFISGNLARARIQTAVGASWTVAKGLGTSHGPAGSR